VLIASFERPMMAFDGRSFSSVHVRLPGMKLLNEPPARLFAM
jgi:hypothetical protein